MRVGVVDVGANTLRLLVAEARSGRVEPVREDRTQLGLGEEIERRGSISGAKLEEAAETVRRHVQRARKLRCDRIEVLITSPGRQARNAEELVLSLAAACGAPVRVLSSDEEGGLAFAGAVSSAGRLPETVALCDVGGGSTQVVVGAVSAGPAWLRSVDLGSLRLTRRLLEEAPPAPEALAAAEGEITLRFAELTPPLPLAALAAGGTARGLRRVVGETLGPAELAAARRKLAKRNRKQIEKEYAVDGARARTLLAGTLILIEVQRRLGVPLTVARGGVREGAALALLAETAATAVSA